MVVLIFVRHGKAKSNELGILTEEIEGFPLTDDGRKRIELTATELKKLKVSRIISSPVQRARETAKIIGDKLGLTPTIDDRLTERGHGNLVNKSNMDGRWIYELDLEKENVENYASIEKRMVDFVDSVKDTSGITVVVTHEDCIKEFIGKALNLDVYLVQGLKIENGTMSAVKVVSKGECKVITINFPFLNKEAVSRINDAI
ncbi:MAG: histidine phosphatase family protein [Candidatus Micrarchaeales archaeon]